jgi:hypothetical protein
MLKYSVILCVILSVIFLIVATLLYPGGNILDKDSTGFDWSKNFFSNLFLVKALNGSMNPSRTWALIGMAFNSIGYGLFFFHTALKIPYRHTRMVLRIIGIVNMLFTFLIATPLHDSMVTVSITLTMLGLIYITASIFTTKLHWLKFFCVGSLLTFYYTFYLYVIGNWVQLAVLQKITYFCFVFLVLAIEYLTSKKTFTVITQSSDN